MPPKTDDACFRDDAFEDSFLDRCEEADGEGWSLLWEYCRERWALASFLGDRGEASGVTLEGRGAN